MTISKINDDTIKENKDPEIKKAIGQNYIAMDYSQIKEQYIQHEELEFFYDDYDQNYVNVIIKITDDEDKQSFAFFKEIQNDMHSVYAVCDYLEEISSNTKHVEVGMEPAVTDQFEYEYGLQIIKTDAVTFMPVSEVFDWRK